MCGRPFEPADGRQLKSLSSCSGSSKHFDVPEPLSSRADSHKNGISDFCKMTVYKCPAMSAVSNSVAVSLHAPRAADVSSRVVLVVLVKCLIPREFLTIT